MEIYNFKLTNITVYARISRFAFTGIAINMVFTFSMDTGVRRTLIYVYKVKPRSGISSQSY